MELQTLTIEEVLRIHHRLVEDFAASDDPISPCGVRSDNLLASAVSRQDTSLADQLKYPDPISNAATLLYGICCDHPFHNGNKRTALVSMLAHLDKNKLTLFGTRQNDLYSMVLAVAGHSFGVRRDPRRRGPPRRPSADRELQAIARWVAERAAQVVRGEQQITYRQLRKILWKYDFSLENPKNNRIGVFKNESVRKGIMLRKQVIKTHVGTIGFPGENRMILISIVKRVRKMCKLREEDGVDSNAFYQGADPVDTFVNEYRTILRRLAKT